MKAIEHPQEGLMLVGDGVRTDPSVTFDFIDSDPPPTVPGEVANFRLVRDGLVVRREWSVLRVGYMIPVADLFRELSRAEFLTIARHVYPEKSDAQLGILELMFRAVAQTQLLSIDERVQAARTAFAQLLGESRVEELFRYRG